MDIKNLFKDQKTNWKYIAITAFAAAIAAGTVLAYADQVNKEIDSFGSGLEIKVVKKTIKNKVDNPFSEDSIIKD